MYVSIIAHGSYMWTCVFKTASDTYIPIIAHGSYVWMCIYIYIYIIDVRPPYAKQDGIVPYMSIQFRDEALYMSDCAELCCLMGGVRLRCDLLWHRTTVLPLGTRSQISAPNAPPGQPCPRVRAESNATPNPWYHTGKPTAWGRECATKWTRYHNGRGNALIAQSTGRGMA